MFKKSNKYRQQWHKAHEATRTPMALEKKANSLKLDWEINRDSRVASNGVAGKTRRSRYGETYAGVHQRYRYRADFSYGQCWHETCDKSAEQWALLKEQDGGPNVQERLKDNSTGMYYSINIEHYAQLCVKHHSIYDRSSNWQSIKIKRRKINE